MIPFQPWLPDIADFQTSVATDAKNVIPHPSGYTPFRTFVPATSAIAARVQGAGSFKDFASGGIHNFAGTATKLYKMATTGLSFSDVTRSVGGDYTAAAADMWRFLQFGSVVLAFNGTDTTQSYTLGSSTLFAAATGSPPIASFGGVIRGFAVLARVSGALNRVRWSAIEDVTDWTASATTMSDSQDFPEGGAVTGFVGGEYGIVFQERAIQRMSFEGPPTIFRFDKLAANMGCRISGSVASHENMAFFYADEGFHMIRGGSEIVPIGEDKIDNWFSANLNQTFEYRVTSMVDPTRHLYIVSFPSQASANGTPDSLLIYNWHLGRWSYASLMMDMIFPCAVQAGYTIDTMDDAAATIDELVEPLDSVFWGGSGRLFFSGFDSAHKQGFFTGTALEATIETGDEQPVAGKKSLVRQIRPVLEGTNATPSISIGYRNNMTGAISYTNPVSVNAFGICPVRANARYLRAKMTIPAASAWDFARGVDDLKIVPMSGK